MDYGSVVSRRGAVLVLAAVLTCLLGIVVSLPPWTDSIGSRVLVSFGDHGVHVSDVPAALCWLVGVVACVRLWRGQL